MSQRRFYLLRVLLYLGFSCELTWPLVTKFSTHFPQGVANWRDAGFGHERGVQQLNIWTIWWNADRVQHLWQDYWNAPIFHPFEGSFALSEPQPFTILLAPLVWCFPASATPYNIYLLLLLTLNGLLAELVLREMKVAWLPALYGGLMVAALPFVHWQRDVIQLMPIWGILWFWLSLSRFATRPSLKRGALVGMAFSCVLLSCLHHALFLVMLSLVACWWLVSDRLLDRRFWIGMGLAAACASVLCGPFLVPQIGILGDDSEDWNRRPELVESLSAYPRDYLWVWQSSWHGPPPIDPPGRGHWNMSPGWLAMALAVFGVGTHLCRWFYKRGQIPFAEIVDESETSPPAESTMQLPEQLPSTVAGSDRPRGRGRWLGLFVTVAIVSLILSCGAHLIITFPQNWQWDSIDIHQFLVKFVPGYKQLRSPFRFGLFLQLSVALLAAVGVEVFWNWGVAAFRKMSRSNHGPRECDLWLQVTWTWAMTAAIGFSLFEVGWRRVPLGALPGVTERSDWVQPSWVGWLIENTDKGDVIVHLPFPYWDELWDFEATTDAMFWQMLHGRRMVNGYSGFLPAKFYELKSASWEFPEPACLNSLKSIGVRWCIVSRSAYLHLASQPLEVPGLTCVFSDEAATVDIYLLE